MAARGGERCAQAIRLAALGEVVVEADRLEGAGGRLEGRRATEEQELHRPARAVWSCQTRRRSGCAGPPVREIDVRADARRR